MNYEREASQLLRRLGANSSYVGFYYVTYGVSQNIQKPELITFITKGLYAEIAIKYQTTVGCVERDMRTVINTIWQHGNRELLEIIYNTPIIHLHIMSNLFDCYGHPTFCSRCLFYFIRKVVITHDKSKVR